MAGKLFDALNAINLKNRSYKYSKKDCNGYMLLMWYSHDRTCIDIVNQINSHLFRMTDEMIFKCLFDSIPKSKRFLKWDKGIKDKKLLKKEEKIIHQLKENHGFSEIEAMMLFKRYISKR